VRCKYKVKGRCCKASATIGGYCVKHFWYVYKPKQDFGQKSRGKS